MAAVWRRSIVTLAIIVLVAGLTIIWRSPDAHGGLAGSPPDLTARRAHVVTLITGDRVALVDGRIAIERVPGREKVRYVAQRVAGHTHLIPEDALPLLRSGLLDRRLFDLTEVAAASRGYLPLIVSFPGGASAAARGGPTPAGATVVRDLPAVRGQALRVDADGAAKLWNQLTSGGAARTAGATVAKIWLDGLRQPTLDASVPQVGAPAAWAAGYDGTGSVVAVLDTGIDATHPDLAGRVADQENFTEGEEDDRDLVGHGTHVASTIAGSGAASGGQYKGVAPGAALLDGKVCVSYGCADSWILAGMQWAVDQGADVVNLSLGGPDGPGLDPIEQAVNTLTADHGVLFVVAAGNSGPQAGSLESPASADAALAVAAVTKSDELSFFSSRGPRRGDGALKPDIAAPGEEITAALSRDAGLGDGPYITASGTSMATPHVAGGAAILAQVHPEWTAEQLKAALMAAAHPVAGAAPNEQGAGRLDVARAIGQSIVASPPSVSFGRQDWPHGDDPVLSRTVTYQNLRASDVTLALQLDVAGPAAFTLSATAVTVPAGGEASVTIEADTTAGDEDGLAGGWLVASAGNTVVQTPLQVDREPESHDLTVVNTDRSGEPAATGFTTLFSLDTMSFYDLYDPSGTSTVRLPVGRYFMQSVIIESDSASLLAMPVLEFTADQTIDADARLAGDLDVTVPEPTATSVLGDVGAMVEFDGSVFATDLLGPAIGDLHTAQLGSQEDRPGVRSWLTAVFQRVDEEGRIDGSPYTYNVAWYIDGHLYTGFTRHVQRADLGAVRASQAAAHDGLLGGKSAYPSPPDADLGGSGVFALRRLPFSWTEYYNTEGGVRWQGVLEEDLMVEDQPFPDIYTLTFGPARALSPGRTITETWNRGVFGPSLAAPPFPDAWASRSGDTLIVAPPLFGDSDGRESATRVDTLHTVVTRDGEVVYDEPTGYAALDVAPENADYRVQLSASRGAPFALSTEVTAAWTFASSHVDGEQVQRLPLTTVRFAPPVDDYNAVPAGRSVLVPLRLSTQPGVATPANRSLVVEVSFDDGRTWERATVTPRGGNPAAVIHSPREPGFVSLRATATDQAGNTATVTIIRAYRTLR